MFYLSLLFKKNKIKLKDISKELKIPFADRFCLHSDFRLDELKKTKEYLVKNNIITQTFDIGNFLDIV